MLLPTTIALFVVVIIGPITSKVASPPSLSDACAAWKHHIGNLLAEHRRADEVTDDEFGIAIGRFYDAQTACDSGRLTEGLAIYDRIPLAAVRERPLQ